MHKFNNNIILLISIITLVGFTSCSSDEEMISTAPAEADAAFSYTIDAENPNKFYFTASPSVETWYEHWNFGDNTAAEGNTAEKIFYVKGDYEVRFKIFTEGGTAETTQTISIAEDLTGSNLAENGTFDDNSVWQILPISDGAEVEISDGQAHWTGGGWGNVGIFQPIEVEGGVTYQIQMDISGSGMSDSWFEVFVGTAEPALGQDYSSGGILMGLNTWDGCGGEPFDGPLSTLSCSAGSTNGIFEFSETSSAYLVIKAGGANLGTEGVTIDNVTIREQ